jgi:DNA mismatch repair protein MutL
LLKVSEEKGAYNVSRSIQPALPGDTNTQKAAEIGLIELRAIAQVHNMYILAEHPTGMWLVEQHIAHERVLYEQLCDRWQLVPLEPSVILNYLTSAQVEQLERLGFAIEPFGDQMWAVRSAPDLLTKREDCAAALLELSLGGDLQTAQVATACRSAIRNGTLLSLSEMQTLLDQWKSTRNPRTCPHGRPIYLSLEESALARFFRRHWVIGKSHGI